MAIFGRMRMLGVGLLATAFVAGALSGAALERVLSADEPERTEHTRERDDDDDRERSYIIDRVEMSEQQRARIDTILDQRTERMQSVWREAGPRLDAITDSARMEIMEVLTPEQRADYERKLQSRRRGRSGDRQSDS